jgi:hypothetical protein
MGGGVYTGDVYFLKNGWKLFVDLTKVRITGALLSDDYDTAYYSYEGVPQYPVTVSSLVTTVVTTNTIPVITGDLGSLVVPTAAQNAAAVRTNLSAELTKINAQVDGLLLNRRCCWKYTVSMGLIQVSHWLLVITKEQPETSYKTSFTTRLLLQ